MVEIIIQKIIPVSVPIVSSDDLWAEFGQLKIADSTRKQYVKAIVEDDAQASRISVSSLTIALRVQRQSQNF
ncbi:MAG: hypothetical protein LH613_18995 [Chamaesiphon sp.]|nr:hypothetical protein [Chamaesiphon sp.]